MKNILITGASGLIGTRLSDMLSKKSYNVKHLSTRDKVTGNFPLYLWNPERGYIDQKALEQIDAIIHLAGSPLYEKKWREKQKKKILESRIKGISLLLRCLNNLNQKPKCFISASGANYYGSVTQKEVFKEENPPGKDFLAKVCHLWESYANLFEKKSIRTVKLRTAIVLSKRGGILKRFEKIIKCYLGAPLGNAKQCVPWIHIDDLCRIYIQAIEDKRWKGSYNAVAPDVINNLYFTKTIAQFLHRPLLFPRIPAFILKSLYGEDFSKILLNGTPLSCQKIRNKGFNFEYPELKMALKEIYL